MRDFLFIIFTLIAAFAGTIISAVFTVYLLPGLVAAQVFFTVVAAVFWVNLALALIIARVRP